MKEKKKKERSDKVMVIDVKALCLYAALCRGPAHVSEPRATHSWMSQSYNCRSSVSGWAASSGEVADFIQRYRAVSTLWCPWSSHTFRYDPERSYSGLGLISSTGLSCRLWSLNESLHWATDTDSEMFWSRPPTFDLVLGDGKVTTTTTAWRGGLQLL